MTFSSLLRFWTPVDLQCMCMDRGPGQVVHALISTWSIAVRLPFDVHVAKLGRRKAPSDYIACSEPLAIGLV